MGNPDTSPAGGSVQPALLPQWFDLAARQFHHRERHGQIRVQEDGGAGAACLTGFEQRSRTAPASGTVLRPAAAPNGGTDPLSRRLLASSLGSSSSFFDFGRLPRNFCAGRSRAYSFRPAVSSRRHPPAVHSRTPLRQGGSRFASGTKK